MNDKLNEFLNEAEIIINENKIDIILESLLEEVESKFEELLEMEMTQERKIN